MAIDDTQLGDVPRRLGARPFAAARAGDAISGDRLKALAGRARMRPASAAAPTRRGSIHRPGRR